MNAASEASDELAYLMAEEGAESAAKAAAALQGLVSPASLHISDISSMRCIVILIYFLLYAQHLHDKSA